MQPPGYVFKNSGLTPPADGKIENVNTFEEIQLNNAIPDEKFNLKEKATLVTKSFIADSHDLAHEHADIVGATQSDRATAEEVRDIGWHKPTNEIPDPLIGGVPNGQLFSLIRRFNKV
jgi:hypothetical protein